jgi:proteasome accessory factor C
MSKIAATDRMARLVAAIPWIVAQDGASVDEIADRFDYPRDLLLGDLQDVVFYVGVPPYTPDTLIEVTIDDDMVWISYADWFSRPMRLSGTEILALLAAGETALAFDTQDEAGALARGLTKLRLATGSDTETVDVQLGVAAETVLPELRAAAEAGRCVDIVYYSFARDERTERRVEPRRFFVEKGSWYVGGYCHRAEAERVFRVDRIDSFAVTDLPFVHPAPTGQESATFSIEEAPRVTLSLPSSRLHLLDGLPVDSTTTSNETAEVTLPVSSARWLDRLMIRIGPGVELLDSTESSVLNELLGSIAKIRTRYVEPQ